MQVERDLEKLAIRFQAKISKTDFEKLADLQKFVAASDKTKELLGLSRKPRAPLFQQAGEDGRIYPGYMAPVIVLEQGQRVIKPMRYRVRPAMSTLEIPTKYNVFNARLDALERRRTWQNIFLKNHGLFPFKKFYEWVEKDSKKQLVNFSPRNHEIMWAPMLYDSWSSANGEIQFSSFALITTEPPKEVLATGHDRSPIFMSENNWATWLDVEKLKKQQAYQILNQQEQTYFEHQF